MAIRHSPTALAFIKAQQDAPRPAPRVKSASEAAMCGRAGDQAGDPGSHLKRREQTSPRSLRWLWLLKISSRLAQMQQWATLVPG